MFFCTHLFCFFKLLMGLRINIGGPCGRLGLQHLKWWPRPSMRTWPLSLRPWHSWLQLQLLMEWSRLRLAGGRLLISNSNDSRLQFPCLPFLSPASINFVLMTVIITWSSLSQEIACSFSIPLWQKRWQGQDICCPGY